MDCFSYSFYCSSNLFVAGWFNCIIILPLKYERLYWILQNSLVIWITDFSGLCWNNSFNYPLKYENKNQRNKIRWTGHRGNQILHNNAQLRLAQSHQTQDHYEPIYPPDRTDEERAGDYKDWLKYDNRRIIQRSRWSS